MSNTVWERAQRVLVGGVNSPVRAYRAVGGEPPLIASAQGSRITDIQGRNYIDYVGSWGPALLGHAHPAVVQRVQETASRGLSFGAPTVAEVELAELLVQRFSSLEMLRCVSSGTEATMSALRVARGYTGRPLIVKFDGCYHGHSDGLLVQAGSGAATFGAPDSAGVPPEHVQNTRRLPYNDLGALRDLFAREGEQIAAVIVEPVVGNMGCVPPRPGFLEEILALCEKAGAVSIFDEVMTGCRLSLTGAQGLYGLKPDLTCLGKIVGGGLPLAVYGGKKEILSCVAPLGPVYQAGTLSGNPLSVAAALATLELLNEELYTQLEQTGARLEAGLTQALQERGLPSCVQRVGSMLTVFFHPGPIENWEDANKCDREAFARFHTGLLKRGVYWPASQFEAAFLSAAHTEKDTEATIEAARAALQEV